MNDTEASWGSRYIGISIVLIALCLPAIYYLGYHNLSFNELLSFRVNDGWCVIPSQSIGQHCFGDYAVFNDVVNISSPWNLHSPVRTAYPPFALLPIYAFVYLGRATGSWGFGRDLFLAVLAASLLTPAAWVSRKAWRGRGPISFLVLGLATAPFLLVVDRGNSTGFIVAPLLGMAIAYAKNQPRKMIVFIVICTLLKPQMILLALLFILFKAYREMIITIVLAAILTIAGFLFFPGSISTNISHWFKIFRGYQTYQNLAIPYPYNLGVGRSILTLFDLSHLQVVTGTATRTHLASWLQAHGGLLTVFLVVVTAIFLFAARRDSNRLFPLLVVCILIMISPNLSYGYYLVLLLVPAAFILRDPGRERCSERSDEQWRGMLDMDPGSDTRWERWFRWLLIVGLALLLVPLVIPSRSVPWLFSQVQLDFLGVPRLGGIGAIQLLWGPILLVLFLAIVVRGLPAPRQATADATNALSSLRSKSEAGVSSSGVSS